MPLFRRSRSLGDFSAPTPTPQGGLLRRLVNRKDPKTLAATSNAIALSISSAFNDTSRSSSDIRPLSSDGATGQGGDTSWRTAYAAVRMAIEVTEASSDMFPPLKAAAAAISALMKNYDQTTDNLENAKDVEQRVQSLYGVLASPIGEDDNAEKTRRAELQRKLDGVIKKLEPLAEQHALLKFLRNMDNAKMLTGFAQELANAITDYQVSMQQGTYERTRNIHNETRDMLEDAILEKLEPVRNAGYQTGHHDKCLLGTRESILRDLMLWAKNPQGQNIFWLNGLAGTGKSTIAQSFSEAAAEERFLGASFFCSRDYLDRRELKNIFPTLTYQLAYHYHSFRSHIISIIRDDPTLAHASLISQLEKLLVNPLSGTKISCVIVIDALDECIDNEPSSAILSVLGQFVKKLPLVKFLITGRPEPRIRTGFRLPLLQPITQIFLLHEVDLTSVNSDIQLYLTQRLTTIVKQRSNLDLPDPWPCGNEIVALTNKSSGLFIFASTTVRFIGSGHHDPSKRLQLLLSKVDNTVYEGCAGIDSLYSQILCHAFSDIDEPEEFATIREILGAIVLAFNPLSQRELATILGTSVSLISTTLRHLHSVILIPSDRTKKIQMFHKSFPDFLQDDKRCVDTRLHINTVTHHGSMALSCLKLVKELKRNPCSLPPFTMNQDIQELPELLENKIGGVIQYACTYWARHLSLSPTSGDFGEQIIDLITSMLQNAPPWIEVMSLENQLGEVIHSMNSLLDWLKNHSYELSASRLRVSLSVHSAKKTLRCKNITLQTLEDKKTALQTLEDKNTTLKNLATDYLQLSMHFFYPIQQCAQQIYYTALPLSPTSSRPQKSYLQSVRDYQLSIVTAFVGAPSTWGLLLRTIDLRPRNLTCIATSSQGIITACGDIVNIYDIVTGVLQQSLSTPEMVTKIEDSPDGLILYFVHSFSVTMYDVQTGGLAHTFTTKSKINDVAVSPTGDHIACGLSNGTVALWNIHTKEEGEGFGNSKSVVTISWLSPLVLAIATQSSLCFHCIDIGETWDGLTFSGYVWGMVHLVRGRDGGVGWDWDEDEGEGWDWDEGEGRGEGQFLVGTSQPGVGVGQEICSFEVFKYKLANSSQQPKVIKGKQKRELQQGRSSMHLGQLTRPMPIGSSILCVTPPGGVKVFDIDTGWIDNESSLLDAVTAVAASSSKNLVVQTKDSIQIFSSDVVESQDTHDNAPRVSHAYPLGENHIICVLQSTKHLTLLQLDTIQEIHPGDATPSLESLLTNQSSSPRVSIGRGLVAEFDASIIMKAWRSRTPLPEWTSAADEDVPLGGLSPECTRIVTVYGSPRRELQVKDCKDGSVLAKLPLEGDFRTGEVYDLTFDSETMFRLKVDGPGKHVQIPYEIAASPSGQYSHTITKGEPVQLSEPRAKPPYTLDANCEWVLDARSRKICWISPRDIRKGNGGHFWAGTSLVMVGEDGVVRKVSFKEPDF